jgi:acetyl esterase/lipase
MMRLLALVVFGFVTQPSPAAAAQVKGIKLPEGTTEYRDLRYGEHKERNTLDLFVPTSDKPLPLIIWVHGGAWQGGSKAGPNPALQFLAKGYAVAAIN